MSACWDVAKGKLPQASADFLKGPLCMDNGVGCLSESEDLLVLVLAEVGGVNL